MARPPPPNLFRLWKTGSVYVVSSWLNLAFPLLLTPVFTRFLTPSDYGRSAMWQVLLTFTAPVVGVSVAGAVSRRYFQTNSNSSEHQSEMRDYIASTLPIVTVSSLVVLIAYVLGLPLIQRYLLDVPGFWILGVPVAAIAMCLTNITLAYVRAEMRAKVYTAFVNGRVFLVSAFSILFIVGLGWNWTGRVAGSVVGMVLCALASTLYLQRRGLLGGKVKWEFTRHALLFSLPLLPHTLASVLHTISDRIFIRQIATMSQVGLFSVALSLAGIFATLGNAMAQAWGPWLYAHLRDENVDRVRIVRITYLAVLGLLLLGLIFAALAPFVFGTLLGSRFAGSARFIWWLAGSSVLEGAYYVVVPYIAYAERNKYSAYISMATLCLNLLLNLTFIHLFRFGVMGVAAANLFTSLFELVAVVIVANHCVPMPWLSVLRQFRPSELIK